MADNRLSLFCLVDGETTSNAFSIKIPLDDTVDDLKDLIKTKQSPDFDDIVANKLILWRVSIPDDDDNDHEIPIMLAHVINKDKKKLRAMRELSTVFTDKPPRSTIHIIVQHPSQEQSNATFGAQFKPIHPYLAKQKQLAQQDLLRYHQPQQHILLQQQHQRPGPRPRNFFHTIVRPDPIPEQTATLSPALHPPPWNQQDEYDRRTPAPTSVTPYPPSRIQRDEYDRRPPIGSAEAAPHPPTSTQTQ